MVKKQIRFRDIIEKNVSSGETYEQAAYRELEEVSEIDLIISLYESEGFHIDKIHLRKEL